MYAIIDVIPTTIGSLLQEHKQISRELELLESFIKERKFPQQEILGFLTNLNSYTLSGHHEKEEQILFKWMLDQNPNADKTIINKIIDEHMELDGLLQGLIKDINNGVSIDSLKFDMLNFMEMYREHIDLEENFIFLIAKGLLAAKGLEFQKVEDPAIHGYRK